MEIYYYLSLKLSLKTSKQRKNHWIWGKMLEREFLSGKSGYNGVFKWQNLVSKNYQYGGQKQT